MGVVKTTRIYSFGVILGLIANISLAADIEAFAGFKLLDTSKTLDTLGAPTQTIPRPNGFVNAYFAEDKASYLAVEMNSKGLVTSIQVSGYHPYRGEDLNGIKLGDSEDKLRNQFGPSDNKSANYENRTLVSFKKVNVSAEVVDSKVVSLKIILTPFLWYRFAISETMTRPEFNDGTKASEKKFQLITKFAMELKKNEDYEGAIGLFTMAEPFLPNDLFLLNNKANCYRSLGDYKNAKSLYLRALEQEPGNLTVLFNYALTSYNDQEYSTATTYFKAVGERWAAKPNSNERESSVEREHLYGRSLAMLGNILDDQGDPKSAIPYYEKAINIIPKNGETYYDLAVAQERLGEIEKAELSARKALELDKDLEEAKKMLKRLQDYKVKKNVPPKEKSSHRMS